MPEPQDDLSAAFTVEGAPLTGRIVRVGPQSLDPILRRHDYPPAVALMLGEALVFAALFGSLLKVEGRLSVQAQGDGPVRLLVAEYRSDGALKGYVRVADGASEALSATRRAPPRDLIGDGVMTVTLDQGEDFTPHQGVAELDADTLAGCAENYFRNSEQIDTRVRLAVGEVLGDGPPRWRAGGMLIQRVAPDQTRGATEEAWRRSTIFFDTLTDVELIDPSLPADRLLYRLYQEDGVRMSEPRGISDVCSCDEGRLKAALSGISVVELSGLTETDGLIHATCEFCARKYLLDPAKFAGG